MEDDDDATTPSTGVHDPTIVNAETFEPLLEGQGGGNSENKAAAADDSSGKKSEPAPVAAAYGEASKSTEVAAPQKDKTRVAEETTQTKVGTSVQNTTTETSEEVTSPTTDTEMKDIENVISSVVSSAAAAASTYTSEGDKSTERNSSPTPSEIDALLNVTTGETPLPASDSMDGSKSCAKDEARSDGNAKKDDGDGKTRKRTTAHKTARPSKKKKTASKSTSLKQDTSVTGKGKAKSEPAKAAVGKKQKPSSAAGRRAKQDVVWSGPPDDNLEGGWPVGWLKRKVRRQGGKTKGQTDAYWITPVAQKSLRSMSEVRRFMAALATSEGDERKAWATFKNKT